MAAGFHALEAFHQQLEGAQLARLGWQAPPTATDELLLPGGSPYPREQLQPLPPWRCDGRIPVAVELRQQDRVLATIVPSAALELRCPRRRLATVALAGGAAAPELRVLARTGWQTLTVAGATLPLWAGNRHTREVSLAWRVVSDGPEAPQFEATLLDAELDVTLEVNGRDAGGRRLRAREPQRWAVADGECGQAFRLRVGAGELLAGRLPPAPGEVPGLGLRVDGAWFLRGLALAELTAHAAASLHRAGPGATLVFSRDLDRRQPQIRELLLRLRQVAVAQGAGCRDEARP